MFCGVFVLGDIRHDVQRFRLPLVRRTKYHFSRAFRILRQRESDRISLLYALYVVGRRADHVTLFRQRPAVIRDAYACRTRKIKDGKRCGIRFTEVHGSSLRYERISLLVSVFYVIDRDLPPGFPVFRYLDFITIVSAEGFGCLPRIDLGIDGIQRIPLSFFRIRRATYD